MECTHDYIKWDIGQPPRCMTCRHEMGMPFTYNRPHYVDITTSQYFLAVNGRLGESIKIYE